MTDNTPTTGQTPATSRPRLEHGCPIAPGDVVTGRHDNTWTGVVREFYSGHDGLPLCRVEIATGTTRHEVPWALAPAHGAPSPHWHDGMRRYQYAHDNDIPLALVPAHRELTEQARDLAAQAETLAGRLAHLAVGLRVGEAPDLGLEVSAVGLELDHGLARYAEARRDLIARAESGDLD